jgi:adenosine kinase
MATVGQDFGPYREWLERKHIHTGHIRVLDGVFTAQAFITTDLDDNQITAFHPGAMNFAELNKISDATGVKLGMVSPDGRTGMIEHAAQFAEADIPFVFDPGQGLPMFDGKDLRRFVEQATWVTVNDYEWQLLKDRTGWDVADVMKHVKALIVTRGAEGSIIYTANEELQIPTAKPSAVEDPTGCGDAFRAGLLYGLHRELDWETTGRIASLMGALKIECHGTQNHSFTLDEFKRRYKSSFGRSL